MTHRWMALGVLLAAAVACTGCANGYYPYAAKESSAHRIGTYNAIALGRTERLPAIAHSGGREREAVVAEAAVGYDGPPPADKLLSVPEGAEAEIGSRAAAERKLIRDAALVVAVADPRDAATRAEAATVRLGGYVQEVSTGGLVLRVPSSAFGAAVGEIEKLGFVIDRKVQARDVTEEYTDLELRLRTKRALLARFEALMQKADKVEDLLKLEQELARLTLEVEQLEGRLRLMASQVALSRIAVEFTETDRAAGRAGVPLPFDWLRTLGLPTLMRSYL